MFACKFENCTKAYKKPSLLEHHENTHLNRRPFACDKCDKKYFKNSHLKVHFTRTHAKTEKRVCKDCSRVLASEEGLKKHEEVCGRVFTCSECKMEFIRAKWYLEHLRKCTEYTTHRPRDKSLNEPAEKEKSVDFTPRNKKSTKTKKEKDLHRCRVCNRGYKLKRNCTYHEIVAHGNNKYECEMCNNKYVHKGSLTRHKASAHRKDTASINNK